MNDRSDLGAFLDHAWQRVSRGIADRRAAARHPVLATVSPEGWPEARTVVLRAARRSEIVIEVHTDAASAKITSLRASPRAQLHIWDEKPRLQIRLFATVEILQGVAVSDHWDRVPDASRTAYGKSPVQGTPIDGPFDYTEQRDSAAFTVLRCHLDRIDLVELADPHRRAAFSKADGWIGHWLVP